MPNTTSASTEKKQDAAPEFTPEIVESPKEVPAKVVLEDHSLCQLFPVLAGRDFARLKEDIRENGLRDPITVHDGKILDGRARYRACTELGTPFKREALPDGSDPVKFLLSRNLHRRHLTTKERALASGRLANLKPGDVASQRNGGSNGPSVSVKQAAALFKVSASSTKRAKTIFRRASKDIIRRVEKNEIPLTEGVRLSFSEAVEGSSQKTDGQDQNAKSDVNAIKLAKDAIELLRSVPKDHPERGKAFGLVYSYVIEECPETKKRKSQK